MSSVNKAIIVSEHQQSLADMYAAGASIPEVSEASGLPRSTVRQRLLSLGVTLRSRSHGVRNAGARGRLGSAWRGKSRSFSKRHRENISKARLSWGEENAKGTSHKSGGYLEYTRGPNKGRLVHVVIMEERIGRRLALGECVHHIDECKTNNCISNLMLMTKSAHAKLHRDLDKARGIERERLENGRFS